MSALAVCSMLIWGANAWTCGVAPQSAETEHLLNSQMHFGSSDQKPARWLKVSSEIAPKIDEKRRQLALDSFKKYPDAFSSEATRSEILAQKIVPNMTPYQAQFAGGSFTYRVKADPRWPKDTNPLLIIETQSVDPDDSEISLTFKNATQYDSDEPISFRVDFIRGRVSNVVALN